MLNVRFRKVKLTATKFLACVAFFGALYIGVAYFVFPSLFPPFYYADYNRAKMNLEAIKGLEILDDWQHHDITLEDCGFLVRVKNASPFWLEFYEGADWREPFRELKKNGFDRASSVKKSVLLAAGFSIREQPRESEQVAAEPTSDPL